MSETLDMAKVGETTSDAVRRRGPAGSTMKRNISPCFVARLNYEGSLCVASAPIRLVGAEKPSSMSPQSNAENIRESPLICACRYVAIKFSP